MTTAVHSIQVGSEESCIKYVGDVAKAIDDMTTQEYLRFILRGEIPERLATAAMKDWPETKPL